MVVLVNNWWAFVIRGVLAVLFGILTFFWPQITLLSLVWLFGAYAIADGVLNIIAAFRRDRPDHAPWWALLIMGILGVIAGIIAFVLPNITALALLYVIAGWAFATGVLAIVAAVRLRKQIEGEWLLALSGVLSIIFGVLVAIFPRAGALALVLWIGAFAFVLGILLIVLGFRLRTLMRRVDEELHGHGFPVIAHGH
jgi:uncharacterized membrane protein HdeD (DUF308 family)